MILDGAILHIKQIHLIKPGLQKLSLGEDLIREWILDLLQREVMKVEVMPILLLQ